MAEPTLTEVLVAIAEVKGQITALTQTTELRLQAQERRLDDAAAARHEIRAEITDRVSARQAQDEKLWSAINLLMGWRNKLIGAASLLGLTNIGVAIYAALTHR